MQQKKIFHYTPKLKAFTIMELMVAMVLFVTVISIGVLLWSNVSNGLRKIQNDSELFYEYISFVTTFEKDFNQAVLISNSGIRIDLSNDIEDISYTFHADSIVRSINNRDTKFAIKTINYELNYFQKTDIIDGIKLNFKLQGKDISCFVYKAIKGRSSINTLLGNGN